MKKLSIAIILAFPFILNIIYKYLQIIQLDYNINDLISYYATIFGVISSLYIFREEMKKYKKEKFINSKPKIIINVEKVNFDANELNYYLTITNCDNKDIIDVYINEEIFTSRIKANSSVTELITYEAVDGIKLDYNENEFDNVVKYPKELLICCSDFAGNDWGCHYHLLYSNVDTIKYFNYYIEAI